MNRVNPRKTRLKRIFAISLTVALAFFLYFFSKLLPDILTNMGIKAYNQKNYKEAFFDLKLATDLSPHNRDARYYLVQSIINQPPTLDKQKELFKISEMNFPDSADLVADRQISTWRNQIFSNVGSNYIEQVPFNDKILRWDVKKFPLKVCVKTVSSQVPSYYSSQIMKAFRQWQSSTENLISFSFVDNPKDAQIVVDIVSADQRKKCDQNDCKYVVAYTIPSINGNMLEKMDITFYDSKNQGTPFSEREVYNTALHEIGHALGIMGHSFSKDDLMYMETGQEDRLSGLRSDFQLISSNDLNTLNLLYMLIPDITNTPLSKFDTSRQFFAPIVLGTDEQINSRKLIEAKNYINGAPELPNGYVDLASAYTELKEYSNAIESLNRAKELSSNDSEKFVVYYNFAIIYMEIKDWDDALNYANLAKQLQPSGQVDGLIAAINFDKGDVEAAKQIYISSLEKQPQNIIDAINLTKIYVREFNLVQAGKTLNRLVEANPDAKSDPRVKSMGLLMFLFR